MLPPVCNNNDATATAAGAATSPTSTPRTTDGIQTNIDVLSTITLPPLPFTVRTFNSSPLRKRSRVEATMEAVRIVSLALDIIDGNDDDDANKNKKSRTGAALFVPRRQ